MTREDLKNYRYTQEWIKNRMEYIEEYRTNIEKITSVLSDMPHAGSKVNDGFAEKIAILLDNVSELTDKITKESLKQKEILQQLEKVEQPYRLLLEKAYIQGKSLVTVASEMNYAYKYMINMHGEALKKFDECML